MLTRMLFVAVIVVVAPALQAHEPLLDGFAQLKRLTKVTDHFSFPTTEGIRTWKQYSATVGTGAAVDADEWSLSRVVNLWSDKCKNMDLANVAIISDDGRLVRFVNYNMIRQGGRPDITVRRGDIVAFLLPDDAK